MSEKIVQLNEAVIKSELKELVRGGVEESLNELLEAEAQKADPKAPGTSAMSAGRAIAAAATAATSPPHPGMLPLKVPKLKGDLL